MEKKSDPSISLFLLFKELYAEREEGKAAQFLKKRFFFSSYFSSDMCVKMMTIKAKRMKTSYLRKNMKFGSKLTLRLFPVSAEEDEALKQSRATTVRTTIRKYLPRERRRAQQDGLCGLRGHTGRKNGDFMYEESTATACVHRHPAGAMAPENTTQYLMGNLYEDMNININKSVQDSQEVAAQQFSECPSPTSSCTALDCESYLAFQERNFDEACEMFW